MLRYVVRGTLHCSGGTLKPCLFVIMSQREYVDYGFAFEQKPGFPPVGAVVNAHEWPLPVLL